MTAAPASHPGALRAGRPEGAQAAGGASGGLPGRRLEVFVVEDNVIVLESLVAALEELAPAHVAGTAADEDVAVRWLQDGRPCDLAIVDIFLHSGSGLGVLAAARRRRPDTALVVLSNYCTDEMRVRCLAAGADCVFDKSREIDLLVGFCTELARRKDGGSPGSAPH